VGAACAPRGSGRRAAGHRGRSAGERPPRGRAAARGAAPFRAEPGLSGARTPAHRPRRPSGRAAIAAALVAGITGLGAAPAPAAPGQLCLPILLTWPSPTPSPSEDPGDPDDPLEGILPPLLGGDAGQEPSPAPAPTEAPPPEPDPDAPVFTLPAAQLGGSSLSISGLRSLALVTVPLADGSRAPVIRIVADGIAIDGFSLDVRKEDGGTAVVNTADRMELHGDVRVYLDSVSATLPGGLGLTLGATTPLPGDELPPTLLRVNLGLVGVTADSIAFRSDHLAVHEPGS